MSATPGYQTSRFTTGRPVVIGPDGRLARAEVLGRSLTEAEAEALAAWLTHLDAHPDITPISRVRWRLYFARRHRLAPAVARALML